MPITTIRVLRGLIRSWTAHLGVWLAVLGYLQTQDKLLTQYFGPDAMGIILFVAGLLVVALRAKTNESLASKGQ
jgi:hypothetical protein